MSDKGIHFLHISDTHISDDPYYAPDHIHPNIGAQALIKYIEALRFPIDFILHTGDVAYDPHPETYQLIKNLFAEIKIPIYYVRGNHDHVQALQSVLMQRAEADLQESLYYSVEVAGYQLIVLDSNGPAPLPAGNLIQGQLDWLNTLCQADDTCPLLVAVHHNILPVGVPWLDNWMRALNGEALHEILLQAQHRLCAVFHGHIHQNYQVMRDGILYVSAASSWRQFYAEPGLKEIVPDFSARPGLNLVSLRGRDCSIRQHVFELDLSEE